MSKKLEEYDIVELLNGYETEMDGMDSDDEKGNELDAQTNIGNIIIIYLTKIKTFKVYNYCII